MAMLSKLLTRQQRPERTDASTSSSPSPSPSPSLFSHSIPGRLIHGSKNIKLHKPWFLLSIEEKDELLAKEWARKDELATARAVEADASLAALLARLDEQALLDLEARDTALAQQLAEEEELRRKTEEEKEDELMRVLVEEEERRVNGVTVCEVCYAEFWKGEEMVQCPECHILCLDCAKTGASVAFSQLDTKLSCLVEGTCPGTYPPSEAKKFLDGKKLELWERLRMEEDCKAAGEGVFSCPHCPYGAIIEDATLEIFSCLNPKCLKQTCISCKSPSHPSLPCALANPSSLHALEEEMTNTFIRTCPAPGCGQKFVKQGGCNKITCTGCRKGSCYICRELITSYAHFDSGPCKGMLYDETTIARNVETVRQTGMQRLTTEEERKHAELLKAK